MVFTALVMSQMAFALSVRSERESVFAIGLFSNRAMLGALAMTAALQLLVIYLPLGQSIFHVVPLNVEHLGIALLLSTLPFLGFELKKWFVRWRSRQP